MSLRRPGFWGGMGAAFVMLSLPAPGDLPPVAWQTAAVAIWMAVWWMTEAVSVAVTALLPMVLFPLLGIADIASVASSYAHPVVYLLMGGFLIALAMERWNLHRRVAFAILLRMGTGGRSIIAGFMLSAALLSMWVTNTATTVMLLPIALAVITVIRDNTASESDAGAVRSFEIALLLCIAYSASIGGMATLIGTPPNALMAGFLNDNYQLQIGFWEWMRLGLPLSMLMLFLCWWLLTHVLFPVDLPPTSKMRGLLLNMNAALGPVRPAEKRVALVFVCAALAWVSRPQLNELPGLEGLSDTGIALTAGLAMFLLPSGDSEGRALLRWDDTAKMPWEILVLFGGGLALAAAVSHSGLAAALGESIAIVGSAHIALLIVTVALLIIFLTELTSNTATTATFLPVLAAVAVQTGQNPLMLVVPATLCASCAFMLPVATPPNAIVYGSQRLTIPQMARAGLALNLICVFLVSLVTVFLVPWLLIR